VAKKIEEELRGIKLKVIKKSYYDLKNILISNLFVKDLKD
jgi:hypothetical protein